MLKIFSSWLLAISWSLRSLEHATIEEQHTFALLWCCTEKLCLAPPITGPSRSAETIPTCTMISALACHRLLHFGNEQHLPLTNGSAASEWLTSVQHGYPELYQCVASYRLPQERPCSTGNGYRKTLCLALSLHQCEGTGNSSSVYQRLLNPACSPTFQVYLPKTHLRVYGSASKPWNNLLKK